MSKMLVSRDMSLEDRPNVATSAPLSSLPSLSNVAKLNSTSGDQPDLAEACVDSNTFREMMSSVPAAVTIIASEYDGVRKGLTATAVCSLSTSPPQLLVCVNQKSSARPTICQSGAFSVNFLASHQEPIARRFSEPNLDHKVRFSSGQWETSTTGVPVLADAVAVAVCEVVSETLHSTHAILIGRVVEIRGAAACPLLYHDRNYCQLGSSNRSQSSTL